MRGADSSHCPRCGRRLAPGHDGCRAFADAAGVARLRRPAQAAAGTGGPVRGAPERRDRFDCLLAVCSADYRAYPGHASRSYPKAALLNQALSACAGIIGTDGHIEALREARALAVAAALRSARWSEAEG